MKKGVWCTVCILFALNLSAQDMYGGYSDTESTYQNTLSVSDRTINGNLYGGYALTEANLNKLQVSHSDVTGDLYGGYSNGDSASGNTVYVSSSIIDGDIYGGFSTNPSAPTIHNTVILSGNGSVSGNIYGGTGPSDEGNTLWLQNYQGEIREVNNFANVTVRGLDSYVGFRRDTQAVFIPSGRPSEQEKLIAYALTDGSSLTLGKEHVGVYRYSLNKGVDGTRTYWTARGTFDRHLAKPYGQAQLAGLSLVSLANEQLSTVYEQAFKQKDEYDLFTSFEYGQNRYDTGSHFDMQYVNLQAGKWWKTEENAFGVLAQYGRGHYSASPVRATGNIDSFGLGGFGLFSYSPSGYLQAMLRGGYQENSFDSSALDSRLKMEGFYTGASVGVWQGLDWLSMYGGMEWTLLFADHRKDNLGQRVRFNANQSLRTKIAVKADLGSWGKGVKTYAELSGNYEFLAEGNVHIDGHKLSNTNLKGLTAKGGMGVRYENANTLLPLKGKISVFGLLGQVQGFGGEIQLMFRF